MQINSPLDRCLELSNVGYFGGDDVFCPEAWLNNFRDSELKYAEAILDNLIYVNQAQVRSLVRDTFSNLSKSIFNDGPTDLIASWESFVRNFVLVPVSDPESTGGQSGDTLVRIAKKAAGVNDSQIVGPENAIERAMISSESYIFFDDIVGSADQFVKFWRHNWFKSNSFSSVLQKWSIEPDEVAKPSFYYAPLFAHERGINRLAEDCQQVKVVPVYTLDDTYSAKNQNSIIWQGRFTQQEIDQFVIQTSRRAGIERDFWGHDQLALCLALETGVPDFCLPLLTHQSSNWNPLFRNL